MIEGVEMELVHITCELLNKVFPYTNGVSWSINEDWSSISVSDDDGTWSLEYNGRFLHYVDYMWEVEHYYWAITGNKLK